MRLKGKQENKANRNFEGRKTKKDLFFFFFSFAIDEFIC